MSEQENNIDFLPKFKDEDARFLAGMSLFMEQSANWDKEQKITLYYQAYHDLRMVAANMSQRIVDLQCPCNEEVKDED
jgi:hypothetical protein